jgi:hypothetical protein
MQNTLIISLVVCGILAGILIWYFLKNRSKSDTVEATPTPTNEGVSNVDYNMSCNTGAGAFANTNVTLQGDGSVVQGGITGETDANVNQNCEFQGTSN